MIDLNLQHTLLRAAAYRDFGGYLRQGKVHLLKDEFDDDHAEQRTFCGKTLDTCPGEIFRGVFSQVDCKVCRNSV